VSTPTRLAHRRWMLAAALFAVLALAAGCASSGGSDGGVSGEPVTVQDALASGDGEVTVRGFLIDEQGQVRLCDTVMESYPPQCGGASLQVTGVDVASLDGATTEGEISWVDQVVVTGTLSGDTLDATEVEPPG
jgi:hypothetical protein